jgi:hypothetical protein
MPNQSQFIQIADCQTRLQNKDCDVAHAGYQAFAARILIDDAFERDAAPCPTARFLESILQPLSRQLADSDLQEFVRALTEFHEEWDPAKHPREGYPKSRLVLSGRRHGREISCSFAFAGRNKE